MAYEILLKTCLAPLLIGQALWVRHRALILPEPTGARSGQTGTGAQLRLLIVGDSSAAGVGAQTQADALSGQLLKHLAPRFSVDWHLIAQTGATTASTLEHLSALPGQPFDLVIVALGVNDITHGATLRRWLAHQNALLDMLTGRFAAQHVLVCGIPPLAHFPLLPQPLRWILGRQSQRYDRALAVQMGARTDATHLPFNLPFDPAKMAPDGFHPGPPAYALWGRALAQHVAEKYQP